MRTLLRLVCLPLLLCLLFFSAPLQAQTGAEDLALPEDPPVPTLTAPAPDATPQAAPVEAGEGVEAPAEFTPNFMRQAIFAGVTVALLCSYLGLFVVSRRMVFIGVGLAEMSSAGIALGLLTGFAPLAGALMFMLLGVVLFSRRWAPRRLPGDAVIGVFYLTAIALGILMISRSPRGEVHALALLRGDILAVYPAETLQMLMVFLGLGLIHALFAKEFLLVSLDRDTAASQGMPAARWDFLLVLTIGVAVAMAIRSVGVLLTATLLVMPAATALLLCSRWKHAALLAPALGVSCVLAGLYTSLMQDMPASALIVAYCFALLFPALLWRSLRSH